MTIFTLMTDGDNYALYSGFEKISTWDERHVNHAYVQSQVSGRMGPDDTLKEVTKDQPFPKELPKATKAPKVEPK